jgi:outer membrane protein assembly factor BamB
MVKRQKTALLTLLLALSIAFPLLALPQNASALSIDTYALLSVGPNPVGVGQTLFIVMWLDKPPPVPETQTSTIRAIPYTNLTVTVTEPDGTETKLGPFTSDSTGSAATSYIPDQVGNYTFVLNYGGETIYGRRLAGDPMTTDYYKPSTSHTVRVSVQEDPIYASTGAPLPTEYWTRPINAQNYEWNVLGGNWLGLPLQFASGCNADGTFNPYSAAPKTGHILWSIPQAFGGIVGDSFNESAYYTGLSYQEKFNPPTAVVINGRLYYHTTYGPNPSVQGLSCVDLQTGKELWFQNATSISFGQLWKVETINVHGVHAFLWSYQSGNYSTLYDAYTGRAILRVSNCQSASKVAMSENGDLMVYTMNANAGWLSLWNSTKAIIGSDPLTWTPSLTATYNWATGLMWNVSIPRITGQTWTQFGDGVIITTAAFREANPPVRTVAGYDANTGANLWIMNLTDYTIRPQYNFSPISEGCFAWFKQETTEWYGFNARTGQQIWGPTEPYEDSFGMYSASFRGAGAPNPQVAYGKIFSAGYDGVVHAIDIKTGKTIWEFYSGATLDTVYGHYPFYGAVTIADGVVFATTNEHTPNDPLWRGGKIFAINATNGQQIWNLSSWATGAVVADGCLLELNTYDGELYNIGKGTSAMTLEAPMTSTTLGNSVVIRGTVSDTSPGTTQDELAKRFSHGVPAVADQSMTDWMEYLYMQQAKPTDAVGVPVTLSVVDANGNYREIGTTTTSEGFFTFSWKPDIEGSYTVYASFGGSESYWPSHAITSFVVDPAAATPTAQPTQAPSMADLYFVPAIAGLFVFVAIIGAVTILVLRKRP